MSSQVPLHSYSSSSPLPDSTVAEATTPSSNQGSVATELTTLPFQPLLVTLSPLASQDGTLVKDTDVLLQQYQAWATCSLNHLSIRTECDFAEQIKKPTPLLERFSKARESKESIVKKLNKVLNLLAEFKELHKKGEDFKRDLEICGWQIQEIYAAAVERSVTFYRVQRLANEEALKKSTVSARNSTSGEESTAPSRPAREAVPPERSQNARGEYGAYGHPKETRGNMRPEAMQRPRLRDTSSSDYFKGVGSGVAITLLILLACQLCHMSTVSLTAQCFQPSYQPSLHWSAALDPSSTGSSSSSGFLTRSWGLEGDNSAASDCQRKSDDGFAYKQDDSQLGQVSERSHERKSGRKAQRGESDKGEIGDDEGAGPGYGQTAVQSGIDSNSGKDPAQEGGNVFLGQGAQAHNIVNNVTQSAVAEDHDNESGYCLMMLDMPSIVS